MTIPDPDWWVPHTDDYAATYDSEIRYAIERGRPGYTHPDGTE